MIVISSSLVLAPSETLGPNNPVVGWHNLTTVDNVTADTEADGYPATNLANPITSPAAGWRADDTTEQAVRVAVNTVEEIDYIAIARHNLGSAQIPVKVEGSINSGADWDELVQEVLLPNDAPAIFRFSPQALTDDRLVLGEGDEPARIGVLYTGKLLILQRRIYVGHSVLHYNRNSRVVNGMSESGEFLGRIVLSQSFGSSLNLQNITPAFFRTEMQPWIESAVENPWFFAWRPGDYPNETGYCFSTSDVTMSNQRSNGMVQVNLSMNGVV